MKSRSALRLWSVLVACSLAGPASAVPIAWTDWTVAVPGLTTGSATGTAGGVTVSYTGQVLAPQTNVTSLPPPTWLPASSFSGGGVDNPPPTGDAIALSGGTGSTNTLTFATPVTNPVMAIWSLGGFSPAQYVFGLEDLVVVVGGPSLEFGGVSIVESTPSTVSSGMNLGGIPFESNGVIRFNGTFTTIDWTVPTLEFFHMFTVGIPTVAAVPEPGTLWLLGIALGLARVYRLRRQAN